MEMESVDNILGDWTCRESRGEEWDIHEGAGMLLRWEAVVLEKGAPLSSTVQRKQEGRGVSPGGGGGEGCPEKLLLGVHGIQFMEFSEVENQDDYYSTEAGCIHTQDQQGVHVMYEEALSDLKELEAELLLVASHYIEKERGHKVGSQPKSGQDWGWAHAGVDRFAVLYDIWTWEAALLENKRQVKCEQTIKEEESEVGLRLFTSCTALYWYCIPTVWWGLPSLCWAPRLPLLIPDYQPYLQLLDNYFEAYQHTLDPEERFALAQVMTDIVHRRPRFDLSHPYFVKAYREECTCLRLHLQLVRGILTQQIERQREYVQRIWREDHLDNSNTFGLPLNIVCKQLISINNSCPASKNIYLLEFHPSLSLVALIPKALEHLFQEACHAYRPTSASGLASLERHVLQLALGLWLTPATPEACYSAQLQKDAVKVTPGFPI
ncbi:uncharacterized protein LOC126953470 [Macaca thibetana thibetana]|uniref:uncharacterized protein LOC126953470 n=1 Tax=Macaca thibetana thibetana TaxID=257877 RepID=UPI0021BC85A0|nr:uncharacterized protein LOC126953470 [Macaca thibetana thibetana]